MKKLACESASLIGAACVVYGLWLIYAPVAWIALGASVLFIAIAQYPAGKEPRP